MVLNGQVELNAPQDVVWSVLLDRNALQKSIPGCQELVEVAPDSYEANLKLGIAAVRGNYQARVQVSDQVPTDHYRLRIEGSGGPGYVQIDGTIQLAPQGGASTLVQYEYEVKVGGTIAAVGQRVLGGVAKFMMGEFFKAMRSQLPQA